MQFDLEHFLIVFQFVVLNVQFDNHLYEYKFRFYKIVQQLFKCINSSSIINITRMPHLN